MDIYSQEGKKEIIDRFTPKTKVVKNSFLAFILFRSSADGMKPTHTGRAVCCVPSADSDVNLV